MTNYRHGLNGTRTHRAWSNMRTRCTNANRNRYANYGGRNITFDTRWSVFENFLADMGECPPGMSLDRIDNDGDYAPGNCRWATAKEQANNTSRNTFITYDGETKTIAEWADELSIGIGYKALFRRLNDPKWTVERAFTQPVRKNGRRNG